jgi:hypothetical protein
MSVRLDSGWDSEIEFFDNDVNSLAELASRRRPVGILREETGGQLERSARYREILRPMGLERSCGRSSSPAPELGRQPGCSANEEARIRH